FPVQRHRLPSPRYMQLTRKAAPVNDTRTGRRFEVRLACPEAMPSKVRSLRLLTKLPLEQLLHTRSQPKQFAMHNAESLRQYDALFRIGRSSPALPILHGAPQNIDLIEALLDIGFDRPKRAWFRSCLIALKFSAIVDCGLS